MAKITVSYRRADSDAMTGRIFDRLAQNYGRGSVFRDIDNIPPGTDFREYINNALHETDVLLVVVGPKWLGVKAGHARIDDEADPVRIEVETAMRQGIVVIPILIGNTKMPSASQLPNSIQDFAFRNAVRIDPGADFDHHCERLMRAIDGMLGARSGAVPQRAPAVQSAISGSSRFLKILLRVLGWVACCVIGFFLLEIIYEITFRAGLVAAPGKGEAGVIDWVIILISLPLGIVIYRVLAIRIWGRRSDVGKSRARELP
jgi:hypothetical protein